jgi:hypothetical protein
LCTVPSLSPSLSYSLFSFTRRNSRGRYLPPIY